MLLKQEKGKMLFKTQLQLKQIVDMQAMRTSGVRLKLKSQSLFIPIVMARQAM